MTLPLPNWIDSPDIQANFDAVAVAVGDTPLVHGGDTAGGALTGTYPNPTLSTATINAILPWYVVIDALGDQIAESGYTNFANSTVGQLVRFNSNNTTDWIEWDIVLAAGTWNLAVAGTTGTDAGKLHFLLDGVDEGSVDFYNAGAEAFSRGAVTGVVVASTGKKRLRVATLDKNGASTGYRCRLISLQFNRTA